MVAAALSPADRAGAASDDAPGSAAVAMPQRRQKKKAFIAPRQGRERWTPLSKYYRLIAIQTNADLHAIR